VRIALPARPEPIEIDREKTAVLLVDMQNAFATVYHVTTFFGWGGTAREVAAALHAK
jgi:nicotinamidase-related amidase